jgi:hypothetical protein
MLPFTFDIVKCAGRWECKLFEPAVSQLRFKKLNRLKGDKLVETFAWSCVAFIEHVYDTDPNVGCPRY